MRRPHRKLPVRVVGACMAECCALQLWCCRVVKKCRLPRLVSTMRLVRPALDGLMHRSLRIAGADNDDPDRPRAVKFGKRDFLLAATR